MCIDRSKKKRTFRCGGAELTQCLCCKCFGIQIGTAYLSILPTEVAGFYEWVAGVQASEAFRTEAEERVFLQLQSSRILLALSEMELKDLSQILQKGLQWTALADPIPFPVSQVVH